MGGVPLDVDSGGVKAPDGGWGWAVLAGCFVITGFSYAFPKAVSVFFKELIREFGVGYSDTAWVSSILLAMLYGTGALLENYFLLREEPFETTTVVPHVIGAPPQVRCAAYWLTASAVAR